METIGKYTYPSRGSFGEALSIAEEALKKYRGIIPNKAAAEVLKYTVKNVIGGEIYKKFEDLTMFGLFKRGRGTLETTDLATEALDPYDKSKASQAKARALRNIKLIADAFTELKGEIPDSNAFPAFLTRFAGISWQEAQKRSESVRKLYIEAFPYLKEGGGEVIGPLPLGGETKLPEMIGTKADEKETAPFGELRTTIGSVVIRDLDTLDIAEKYIELLRKQFGSRKRE